MLRTGFFLKWKYIWFIVIFITDKTIHHVDLVIWRSSFRSLLNDFYLSHIDSLGWRTWGVGTLDGFDILLRGFLFFAIKVYLNAIISKFTWMIAWPDMFFITWSFLTSFFIIFLYLSILDNLLVFFNWIMLFTIFWIIVKITSFLGFIEVNFFFFKIHEVRCRSKLFIGELGIIKNLRITNRTKIKLILIFFLKGFFRLAFCLILQTVD